MAKIYGNHLRVHVVDSMRKGFIIGVGVHWFTLVHHFPAGLIDIAKSRCKKSKTNWAGRSGKIW